MLVLSRERHQVICIGDDIRIEVVDIRGDKVRLGITAPIGVTLHRKEVYDAIRRENRATAAAGQHVLAAVAGSNPGEQHPSK